MRLYPWKQHVVAGVVTSAALAGLLLLLSRISSASFVPLDIADAMIRLTPGAVATFGIETLGSLAKLIIELTGSLILIIFGGAIGWLYGRIAPRPLALAAIVLAIIPTMLTLLVQSMIGGLRGGVIGFSLTILAYLGWGGMLAWIINRVTPSTAALLTADPAQETSRRIFLLRSAGTMLAVAVGTTAIAELLGTNESDTQVAGAGQALPTSAPVQPTAAPAPTSAPTSLPAATTIANAPTAQPTDVAAPTAIPEPSATPVPAFAPAPGTRAPFNTNETLYVISSSTRDPIVERETWKLMIAGAVDTPFDISYNELLAMPRIEQTSTLACISNEVGNYLIGNVMWTGIRLRDLLERAGVQDGVIDVKLTAAEGYTESIPLAKAMDPTSIIAYGIGGEALVVKHGFPARLIVPGLYGVKNVKWLTKIELVRTDYKGYWQQRGWTDDATITTTAVFDTGNPRLSKEPLRLQQGIVPLGGVAFAGNRGITTVEIRIDDGEWTQTTLDPQSDPLTWRVWRYNWAATPGKHTLTLRAVDGTGQPQIEKPRDTHPDGATGYHIIMVEVA